ncbi:MAG: outer membrane protein assembly factor BamE [Planctomycetes bacterium]|nr:outer membrane protein assembly factor BamE [Planctomycetota bacterium]
MVILGSAAAAQFMAVALFSALVVLVLRAQDPLPLRAGMSEAQVEDLLGSPTRRSRADRISTWIYADSDAETVLSFCSGRVRRIRFL